MNTDVLFIKPPVQAPDAIFAALALLKGSKPFVSLFVHQEGFRGGGGGGDRMSPENSDSEFGGGDPPRGAGQRSSGGGRFDSSQRSGSMDRSVKRVRRVGGGGGESPEQITPRSSRRF